MKSRHGDKGWMARQGDVMLVKIDEIPKDVKSLGMRKELAYGEVTGHSHRIDVGELFETKNGELYLRAKKLAKLSHEEHKAITLAPGCYRVGIKRQFSSNEWEKVRD